MGRLISFLLILSLSVPVLAGGKTPKDKGKGQGDGDTDIIDGNKKPKKDRRGQGTTITETPDARTKEFKRGELGNPDDETGGSNPPLKYSEAIAKERVIYRYTTTFTHASGTICDVEFKNLTKFGIKKKSEGNGFSLRVMKKGVEGDMAIDAYVYCLSAHGVDTADMTCSDGTQDCFYKKVIVDGSDSDADNPESEYYILRNRKGSGDTYVYNGDDEYVDDTYIPEERFREKKICTYAEDCDVDMSWYYKTATGYDIGEQSGGFCNQCIRIDNKKTALDSWVQLGLGAMFTFEQGYEANMRFKTVKNINTSMLQAKAMCYGAQGDALDKVLDTQLIQEEKYDATLFRPSDFVDIVNATNGASTNCNDSPSLYPGYNNALMGVMGNGGIGFNPLVANGFQNQFSNFYNNGNNFNSTYAGLMPWMGNQSMGNNSYANGFMNNSHYMGNDPYTNGFMSNGQYMNDPYNSGGFNSLYNNQYSYPNISSGSWNWTNGIYNNPMS